MGLKSLTSLKQELGINGGKYDCNLRNDPTTSVEAMPKGIGNAGVEWQKCRCDCGNQRRPPVQI